NALAVIDVSSGSISGNAGFIEVSAFEQLGFYGVLNGRAPPGYEGLTAILDPTEDATIATDVPDNATVTVWASRHIIIGANIQIGNNAKLYLLADHQSNTLNDWDTSNSGKGIGAIQNSNYYTIFATSEAADTYLYLRAGSGIGSSSHPIKTNVDNIDAKMNPNDGSGGIYINQGDRPLAINSATTKDGDIIIVTTGDITLGTITASGKKVSITTSAGSVLDGNGNFNNNITAKELILTAATGIGSNDSLETVVSKMKITNGSGNVRITNNSDNLTLDNFGSGNAISNKGDVEIISTGNITVKDKISVMGDVILVGLDIDISKNAEDAISADNITLKPVNTDTTIGIGGNFNKFRITDNDLDRLACSGTVTIGRADGTGAVKIGDIDLSSISSSGKNEDYSLVILGGTATIDGSITMNTNKSITVSVKGDLTINKNKTITTTGAGIIKLIADSDENGTGSLSFNTGVTLSSSSAHYLQGENSFNIDSTFLSRLTGNPTTLNVKSTKGDITISISVSRTGTITLISNNGAIIDNNTSGNDLIAPNLILSAKTGIGSGNALETQVSNLQATNTTSGDINITNTGNLFATSVNNASGGKVNLTVNSDLKVGLISASEVSLVADGSIYGNAETSPNILANVLYLNAGQDIGKDDEIIAEINELYAYAGGSINISDISEDGFTLIDVQGGLKKPIDVKEPMGVIIYADNDINVGYVYDSVRVILNSNNGSIKGVETDFDVNIETEQLNLYASDSIYGVYNANGDSSGYLTTRIQTLNAQAGTLIKIWDIGTENDEVGQAVILNDVQTIGPDFSVDIVTTYDMQVGYVSDLTDVKLTSLNGAIIDANDDGVGVNTNIVTQKLILSAKNGIGSGNALETEVNTLNATNTNSGNIEIDNTGDLILGSITTPGDVIITVSSSILDDSDETNYISADTVNLTANKDIGSSGDGDIDTKANSITLSAGGDIYLEEYDGAGFSSVTANRSATIFANDSSTLGSITTGADFSFTISSGAISVQGPIKSNSGGVKLNALGGSIVALGLGPHLISQANSTINTSGVIGSLATPFDVSLSSGNLAVNIGSAIGGISGVLSGSIPSGTILHNSPPGIIYFNGQQIWPPLPTVTPPTGPSVSLISQGAYLLVWREFLSYLEILANYQLNSFVAIPIYFYHPLTETDLSAFNEFILEEGAYEFIDGAINILGHEGLFDWLKKK
ncbi:MAG: hypothetical protein NC918_02165, partial [Candidatus Omnitrophica bacterium]|nr:hypothetical protein [Candidatus Omnitrophota bacterium]